MLYAESCTIFYKDQIGDTFLKQLHNESNKETCEKDAIANSLEKSVSKTVHLNKRCDEGAQDENFYHKVQRASKPCM